MSSVHWYETGRCLEPIRLIGRVFMARMRLPNGKVVNVYRARQKNKLYNEWLFYYYRGHRFLITEKDYSDSTLVEGK